MKRLTHIAVTIAVLCAMSGIAQAAETDDNKSTPTLINMAAPPNEGGNTYARAMSSVLSFLGTERSYDDIMGLTGVAFILQIDTSGPYTKGELDCAWWPNDAWGFDLGLPVLSKATGWELRKVRCDSEAYKKDPAAAYRRSLAPALKKSLAARKPVLTETDFGFIVLGEDKREPPLLGHGAQGKSTQFGSLLRIPYYPWGLIVFGKQSAPGRPGEVDLASLRHIIALYHEKAQGPDAPKTRFSGQQAWAEWLRLLHAGSAADNNMLICLQVDRRSAVAYLRDMAKRHNGEAAARLSAAADLYQRVLDDAKKQGLPWNRVQSGENEKTVQADFTAMVERVSKLEAQAIAELEAAAASIAQKP